MKNHHQKNERSLHSEISTDRFHFGNISRIIQIARSYNAAKWVLIIISGILMIM